MTGVVGRGGTYGAPLAFARQRALRATARCCSSALLIGVLLTVAGCATNLNDPRFKAPGPETRVIMSDAYREKLDAIARPYAEDANLHQALVEVMKYDSAHQKLLSAQIAQFINRRITRTSDWHDASRDLYQTHAELRSVLINPFFSRFSPTFILPLEPEPYRPPPQVLDALRAFYGPQSALHDLKVYRISESAREPRIGGLTLGPVAYVNDYATKAVADYLRLSPDVVRDVIVTNEVAHLIAARLELSTALESHNALRNIEEALNLKREINPQHVNEFLSDAASVSIDPAGLALLMESVSAAIVKRGADGRFLVNPDHSYALSAEVLVGSLDRHAKSYLTVAEFEAYSRAPYWSLDLLPSNIPKGLYDAIKSDFVEKGRRVLAVTR